MRNLWSTRDAEAMVVCYAAQGVGREVAECIYLTRLMGGDKQLVLHGGGNSSVKTLARDAAGVMREVICVKASGADMADVEPEHLPALDLKRMRELRQRDKLPERELRGAQRACLLDGGADDPSVDAFLHAFLPQKFIAHCHANAVLSVTNQADGEVLSDTLFAGQVAVVPYTMSGLDLARRAAEAYEAEPGCGGLILMHHGLVTFAEDARGAYNAMVAIVSDAEEYITKSRQKVLPARTKGGFCPNLAEVAPILRGALGRASKTSRVEEEFDRQTLAFRANDAILGYLNDPELARYTNAGVVTPDHVIHIKNRPFLLPAAKDWWDGESFRKSVDKALLAYMADYRAYLRRNARPGQDLRMLADARPRVALAPGLGLFGIGRGMAQALINADLAEATIKVVADAECVGRYKPAAEADIFAIESWAPERAKLQADRAPLAGQVAAISGGAGVIGAAIVREFANAGAAVAVLDLDGAKANEVAKEFAPAGRGFACDVTDEVSVGSTFSEICAVFGGIDILISNAGAAWQGRIGDVPEELLRQSFELNFFAHQRMAHHAVGIMRAQATGGCLLFNTSKQAINPGADFGPYGLPKAATLFLMRQYALDHGRDGIRSNAVNADRIRSGLLTEEMIDARARARGISERDYMTGNLLGQEVTAEDVARTFLHQALSLKTTGNVATVDGGNIAAAVR
ncbi:MAG: bifunctional aldolase/short-chain dehydrogenase [Rhodospirillaceae bacterium]|nr:bifunctional aldolase/short-chain dehydrogenase [Rhodospirillaceae bacterium]